MEEEDNEDDSVEEDEGKNVIDFNAKEPIEEEETKGEELKVDFEFLDPSPSQLASVKMKCIQYLEGISWRAEELANIVLSQVRRRRK